MNFITIAKIAALFPMLINIIITIFIIILFINFCKKSYYIGFVFLFIMLISDITGLKAAYEIFKFFWL